MQATIFYGLLYNTVNSYTTQHHMVVGLWMNDKLKGVEREQTWPNSNNIQLFAWRD
jgi:hypothetical protein